jgi:GTP-binding protein LepA
VFFRVIDGAVKKGDKVRFINSKVEHEINECGILTPNQVPVDMLRAGEVGYMFGSIKDVTDARVGDTITLASEWKAAGEGGFGGLEGYKESTPMMYAGLFPTDADDYETLRDSLGKLRLNDAALSYEPENSGALGFGFR